MQKYDKYKQILKNKLSEQRYYHCLCVGDKAVELAKIYGADIEKAYVAGIIHDIMKEEKGLDFFIENNIDLLPIEKNNYRIQHQISGAYFAKNVLGLDDDIVSAIRYHATGRENMTLLDMIIYVADLTSKDRTYGDVQIMREKAITDLYDAMLYGLCYTIKDLTNNKRQIHPDTLLCYNWVLDKIKKDSE